MNCDPNTLSLASSCLRCLTDAQLMLAKTSLLCKWANAAGAGGNFGMAAPTSSQWTWTDTGGGTVTAALVSGCAVGADGFQLGACASPCSPTSNIIGTTTCSGSEVATLSLGTTALGQIRWTLAGVPVSGWSTVKSVTLTLDTVIADWLTRIAGSGGTAPTTAQVNAHDIFVKGLRSKSIFSKVKMANAFVNRGFVAAATPFIKFSGDIDTWTTNGFGNTDVTANGLVGNGGSVCFTTIIPSAIFSSDSNAGISIYCFTTNNNTEFEFGCFDGTGAPENCFNLSTNYTDTKIRADAWENTTLNGETQVASPNVGGFTSYSKVAINDSRVYFANSTTAFGQQGATNANNTTGNRGTVHGLVVMGTRASSGTLLQVTTKTVSLIILHDGLTSSETQSLYNLSQALRVNLGGGFV